MPYDRSLAIAERHKALLALIETGGRSAATLAKALGVSEATINRDVSFLRGRGHSIIARRLASGWAFECNGSGQTRFAASEQQR
ncbi:HTH domain-containing protein [Sphingomonas trueperi]|uniref:HTH domain-containing protein n=1 Tax=Sphingomonas trueperi TaxID=53317 RepID=UPI000EB2C053